MKKEYAKNLQKALFVAFLFQFVTIQATQPQLIKKEESWLSRGYKAIVPQKIQDVVGKIAAGVEVPLYWYPKLGYLEEWVELADRIVDTLDNATRKWAKGELRRLVDRASDRQSALHLDLMGMKKITNEALTTIIKSTDQQKMAEARDYLTDILVAMKSQKEDFEKLGSNIFPLSKIVEKAAAVVKAEDDKARDVARKALADLIADKNLDLKVKKLIQEDINVLKKSFDRDDLNKAYEHLGYVIDAVDMAKTNISEVVGYGTYAYRKIGDLVKKFIPESVRTVGPWVAIGFMSGFGAEGIRKRLNKYKVIALWPEVEKKVEEGIEWKEKAMERAAQVMAEGRNPWEDDTWADLYAKEQKSYHGANRLLDAINAAGVPGIVIKAFVDKVNEILGGMYVGKPKETSEELQPVPSEK